jgi:Leucine-rich repeat (LRR) protein
MPKLKQLSLNSFNEIEFGFLSGLPQIESLSLSNVRLNKRGVDAINQLGNLKRLTLSVTAFDDERLGWIGQLDVDLNLTLQNSPKITDEGLKHLVGSRLQSLSIIQTSITDRGLIHIGNIKALQTLMIYGSPVTDAGIEHLRELKSLRFLMLYKTKVTEEGLARIKEAIPNLMHAKLGAIGRPRRVRNRTRMGTPSQFTYQGPWGRTRSFRWSLAAC